MSSGPRFPSGTQITGVYTSAPMVDAIDARLTSLEKRVAGLERLWKIAYENPDLVRELALLALGRVDPP